MTIVEWHATAQRGHVCFHLLISHPLPRPRGVDHLKRVKPKCLTCTRLAATQRGARRERACLLSSSGISNPRGRVARSCAAGPWITTRANRIDRYSLVHRRRVQARHAGTRPANLAQESPQSRLVRRAGERGHERRHVLQIHYVVEVEVEDVVVNVECPGGVKRTVQTQRHQLPVG